MRERVISRGAIRVYGLVSVRVHGTARAGRKLTKQIGAQFDPGEGLTGRPFGTALRTLREFPAVVCAGGSVDADIQNEATGRVLALQIVIIHFDPPDPTSDS